MACLSPTEQLLYGETCTSLKDLWVSWEKIDSATSKDLKKALRQFYHHVMPIKYLVKTVSTRSLLITYIYVLIGRDYHHSLSISEIIDSERHDNLNV